MSHTYTGHVSCPTCGKLVSVKSNGKMYRHGPQYRCPGATNYVVQSNDSPRAREVVIELHRLWRMGDALAAAYLTGIPYPTPQIADGLNIDQELACLIDDARVFIADVARRIGAKPVPTEAT